MSRVIVPTAVTAMTLPAKTERSAAAAAAATSAKSAAAAREPRQARLTRLLTAPPSVSPRLAGGNSARRRRDPQHGPLRRRARIRWAVIRTLIVLLAVSAATTLMYPVGMQWFAQRAQSQKISRYVQNVKQLTATEVTSLLAAAHAYNRTLPPGQIQDPYSKSLRGNPVTVSQAHDAYEKLLDAKKDGMMGQIIIPAIRVDLPIYHDTTPAVLDKGVGHLYGSSLPVGGAGTHAVLTAHSGVPTQALFTDLDQLRKGSTFEVDVLGQVLTYQVNDIRTVLPDQISSLTTEPGQDLVTLVTCTPVGVNSHRLLVTGSRIPTPKAVEALVNGVGYPYPGFPWWALVILGAFLLAFGLVFPRRQRLSQVSDFPWVSISARSARSLDYRLWRRWRAVVATAAGQAGNDDGGQAVLDGDMSPSSGTAGGQAVLDSGPAPGFTWSLKNVYGRSDCASFDVFPTAQAARADAQACVEAARGLSLHVGRRAVWWAEDQAGRPRFFHLSQVRRSDVRAEAFRARLTLSQVRVFDEPEPSADQGDDQGDGAGRLQAVPRMSTTKTRVESAGILPSA